MFSTQPMRSTPSQKPLAQTTLRGMQAKRQANARMERARARRDDSAGAAGLRFHGTACNNRIPGMFFFKYFHQKNNQPFYSFAFWDSIQGTRMSMRASTTLCNIEFMPIKTIRCGKDKHAFVITNTPDVLRPRQQSDSTSVSSTKPPKPNALSGPL